MRSIRIALVLVGALVVFAAFGGQTSKAAGSGEPLCEAHPGSCLDTHSRKSYEGDYVGHDEPSLLFYSNQDGSGNSNVWHMQIPKEAPLTPLQNGLGGTWNFQLHPAFWFGMAMCDTQSYPNQNTNCTPDSDSNIKVGTDPTKPDYVGNHAGTAFMELQFYPPGYVQQFTGFSCAARQWCSALTIDGLSDDQTQNNNGDCLERAGEEYVNFAYLTLNGVPQGPPDPLNFQFVGSGQPGPNVLYMNPGDKVTVSIHDSLAGLVTTVHDDTTGQTGSMTASIANGFAHPLFRAERCDVQRRALRLPRDVRDLDEGHDGPLGGTHVQRRVLGRDRPLRVLRRQGRLRRHLPPADGQLRGQRRRLLLQRKRLDC